MAHGTSPASRGAPDDDLARDDGTLARVGSPTPDTVGLDSKDEVPAKNGGSIASRVVSYATRLLGQRVGDGECFTLVDRALRPAGAKSAADFGTVTPTADYVWGTEVSLPDVRSGDIVQFRDYRYDREVEHDDGSADMDFQERPHHTAIVEHVHGGGALTVLEQNASVGTGVARARLFFSTGTTTITVQGTVWFYRAEPN